MAEIFCPSCRACVRPEAADAGYCGSCGKKFPGVQFGAWRAAELPQAAHAGHSVEPVEPEPRWKLLLGGVVFLTMGFWLLVIASGDLSHFHSSSTKFRLLAAVLGVRGTFVLGGVVCLASGATSLFYWSRTPEPQPKAYGAR